MNASDFQQIRELLARHRAGLEAIKRLCLFEPDLTPDDIARDLTKAEEELGAFIEVVQNRRRMAWEDRGHRPRHDPPPRWTPLKSADVEPNAVVPRLDVNGHQAASTIRHRPLSGEWQQQHPRRRHG